MDKNHLYSAGRVIVARNLTEHVVAATVAWDEETSKLSLRYYLDREPHEDDEEECEIAMTELIGEFPYLELASTECIRLASADDAQRLEGVVFIRRREEARPVWMYDTILTRNEALKGSGA